MQPNTSTSIQTISPKEKLQLVISSDKNSQIFLKKFTKIEFDSSNNKLFTTAYKLAANFGFKQPSTLYARITENEELLINLGSFWMNESNLDWGNSEKIARVKAMVSQGKRGVFCISPRSAVVLAMLCDSHRSKNRIGRLTNQEIGTDFRNTLNKNGGSKQAITDFVMDIITHPENSQVSSSEQSEQVAYNGKLNSEKKKPWIPLEKLKSSHLTLMPESELQEVFSGITSNDSCPETKSAFLELTQSDIQASVFVDASVCREKNSTIIAAYFPDIKEGVVEKFNMTLNITSAEITAIAMGKNLRPTANHIYTDCKNAKNIWQEWSKSKSLPKVEDEGYELTTILKTNTDVRWIPRERNLFADSLAKQARHLPSGQKFWFKLNSELRSDEHNTVIEWKIDETRIPLREFDPNLLHEILKEKTTKIRAEIEAEFEERYTLEKEKAKLLMPMSAPPAPEILAPILSLKLDNLTIADYMTEELLPEYREKLAHLEDKITCLELQLKDVCSEQRFVIQEIELLESTTMILKRKI